MNADRTRERSARNEPMPRRRILVLGANGPAGRRAVRQALDRGYAVTALTRRPESFPIEHDELIVIGGDATDSETIDAVVAPCDAVISVIGSAFTWRPVEVYSATARLVVNAMLRHGVRRLVVVTSTGVATDERLHGVLARLGYELIRKTFARTVYDDMARMEKTVSASALDWTIVRPPLLTDDPGTGYAAAEGRIDGPCVARDDLAEMLVDQLDDDRYVRRIAGVTTPGLRARAVQTIRREVLKR